MVIQSEHLHNINEIHITKTFGICTFNLKIKDPADRERERKKIINNLLSQYNIH